MLSPVSRRGAALLCAAVALSIALAGCGGKQDGPAGGRGAGPTGPVEAGYVVVQPTNIPVLTELAGRTSAYQTSEVRPQVNGLIRRRFFTEGSYVRKGQPLYQIDPSLYQAAANEARANLDSAQANADAAKVKSDRYRPLAKMQALSAQDYTDAAAAARVAKSAVDQNRAALETARINLRFTTVPAPISGKIGRSLFTEGALVSSNQTDPLAVIQRLDPIYVDIQQSSAALLGLRRSLAVGDLTATSAQVKLKLEDGSDYGYSGTVEFAEATVDTSTGTVTLRARFPNPDGLLLPGMFVRALFAQAIDTQAFLVPQAAVSRDPKGQATVMVVGPNNKAVPRNITTVRTEGANWVVTDGLKPGDKVIVQGLGKLQPNAQIKPVPANTPQRMAPPQGQGGNGQKQGGGQGGSRSGNGG